MDVTPEHPVPLAGYGDRHAPFKAVRTALECNALVLSDARVRLLLVSIDALYAGPVLTDAVHAVAGRHGIAPHAVVVAASHTHFAPATDPALAALGRVDEAWFERCQARITEMLDGLLKAPLAGVQAETVQVRIPLNVNRRRSWPWPTWTRQGLRLRPRIVMAPAPQADRDDAAWLLRLRDDQGRILAWVWKYACHPTASPLKFAVDAEYPGTARGRLRELAGAPVPVVFLQGFAGDVRPWLVGRRGVRQRIATLRRGPDFGTVSSVAADRWGQALAERLAQAASAQNWTPLRPAIGLGAASRPMKELGSWSPAWAGRELRVQHLALGEDHDLLFMNAEVCSPWLALARPGRRLVACGYAGACIGYLPDERQLREGGYEAGDFVAAFGLQGQWRPGFGDEVRRCVLEAYSMGSSSMG